MNQTAMRAVKKESVEVLDKVAPADTREKAVAACLLAVCL